MTSREIQDGVQDGRQIKKSQFICNIGNAIQSYTSFCPLSIAARIISSRKCILNGILSKFWHFKTIMALWGQISRLLMGRLNSDHNLESNIDFYLLLVIDILTQDITFIHLTPFICSRTSEGQLNYPTPKYHDRRKSQIIYNIWSSIS